MLTPEQKAEAEKKLKLVTSQIENQKKIKDIIKNSIKTINDLIASLWNNPKAQKTLLLNISNKIGPKILMQQKLFNKLKDAQEQMKNDKDRINKQKLYAIEDRQKISLSVKQYQKTIQNIQQAVKSSVKQESQKRNKISQDMQKSLNQIQQKIIVFNKQSQDMEKENQSLKIKKKQLEDKKIHLQNQFKKNAELKDQQVSKQKYELMEKLKLVQTEVSEITEINKEFSARQKGNFDKKLSLYLRTKKFPQFSTSFQNSAKTIDQCKEQLFKGVQRMNKAKEQIEKYDKESKEYNKQFLIELVKKVENEQKVQAAKKQKELCREKIIAIQSKLKQKKNSQPATV